VSDVPLRLAFAGTPELAAAVLQSIIDGGRHSISLVFTQPDRPAGRGRRLQKSAVKILAQHHHLQIREPVRSGEFDPGAELADVDALVVAAYGLILPPQILNRSRLGCINVHTSLLPRWRGAAPIQRALQAGDKETGITIMQMDAGLDSGDILLQRACPIQSTDTAATLEARLAQLGSDCLLETLDLLALGHIRSVPQDGSLASYAGKISKQEGHIDWNRPALELERMVRAFNPHPVAFTELNGITMRVWEAQVVAGQMSNHTPGTVTAAGGDGIDVCTGEQMLRLLKVQLPGKKIMTAGDFSNGHPGFLSGGSGSVSACE